MTYRTIRIDEDIYETLMDLKYDYRERSLSATLAHIFHELGLEPFDEDADYDEE